MADNKKERKCHMKHITESNNLISEAAALIRQPYSNLGIENHVDKPKSMIQ